MAAGRRDGGDHHVAGTGLAGERLDRVQADLGDVLAVLLDQPRRDPDLAGQVGDRLERRLPGDLQRTGHRHLGPPFVSGAINGS